MKVQSVQIKNFKAVEEVDLQLAGNHVYVTGPNDKGKSSFLDFIFGFTGKTLGKNLTLEKPSEMITKGHDKMEGIIDMGEYQIQVKGKRVKGTEKIQVELFREGALMASPRTLLDELIGVNNFDINGFLRMSEKDQVSFYKKLLGIEDKLLPLDQKYETKFKERTDLNRDIKRVEAEAEAAKVPLIGKDKPEPVDLQAILAARKEAEEALREYREKEGKLEHVCVQIKETDGEIAELQRRLQELHKTKANLEALKARGDKWKESAVKPELPDVQELVTKANETNALVAKFSAYEQAAARVKTYHKELSNLEEEMERIDQDRKMIIAQAEQPVPGMTFDDENGLMFKGLPFKSSQVNTATQIIIALQLQLPLMKTARFVRFDASLLDAKSMEMVKKWAAKHDLQLFMEVVDRSAEGGLRFEIEETIAPQEIEEEVGF